MSTAKVDLHKLARITNFMIASSTGAFFFAGYFLSFWFHFGTVFFLMLTVANFFYRHVQTQHTILRNFGVIGQMRYVLESVGPELRQYLFSTDTEERPFNRVERAEVYRKAKGIEGAQSFGSQYNYDENEIKLRHAMFPTDHADLEPYRLTFGEERGLAQAYTIDKPIVISAMSFGSLGSQAVRTLSRGARLAGIPMNTGEGGYPKYHLQEGADLIFQMGTAKFGVRNDDGSLNDDKLTALAAHEQIKMVEIKFSQGAKPGKGGLLPKEKITTEISELRGVPMGQDVVSPPYHVECRNLVSTVKFIRRVQEVAGVPVGIKLCVGRPSEVGELFEEMKRQEVFPDYISIDGGEGGTGAAPKAYLDGVGMPLLPALKSVGDMMVEMGVRDRMKLLAAGKLVTPGRQVGAMCLGADAVYTARGFMLAIGCIQALQCGNNTCPVGITTHDPSLQRGLVIEDKAYRIANYVKGSVKDIEHILCSMGVRRVRELTFDHLYVPHDSILSVQGDAE
ncbi:MAG: FMN-binding glutamate synthase family protein [Planctomycetota bacterium]|nr:FMN-binding glutamate synthase family protein [Planctomycetota bacterium]